MKIMAITISQPLRPPRAKYSAKSLNGFLAAIGAFILLTDAEHVNALII
jgi:hypothetical protein